MMVHFYCLGTFCPLKFTVDKCFDYISKEVFLTGKGHRALMSTHTYK